MFLREDLRLKVDATILSAPQHKSIGESSPVDWNSKTRIAGQLREDGGPCPEHIFLIFEVRRPPWPHMCSKPPWRSKGEWCQEMFYPYTFLVESTLAKRCVRAHQRFLRNRKYAPEPGTLKWLAKGNLEEMPHKSNSNCHKGTTQGLLSFRVCPYAACFFLLINTLLASLKKKKKREKGCGD